MPSDWQAELTSSTPVPSAPVWSAPPSVASTSVMAAQLITAPPKSFAAAVRGTRSPPVDEPLFPVPCIKGDSLSIRICHNEYAKGDKPYTARDLASKLGNIWKVAHQWKMLSLGRGFYDFLFEHSYDFSRIWTAGTVSLQPGLLRLSQWTKDFNQNSQTQTHTSLCIRLVALP